MTFSGGNFILFSFDALKNRIKNKENTLVRT